MPYTIREAYLSGELTAGGQRGASREFFVFDVEPPGSTTETSVLAAVRGYAAQSFDGMPIQTIAVQQVANTVWKASVEYAPAEQDPPAEWDGWITTFSTNGASETVYLAQDQGRLSLITEDPIDCPDHGLQIGVTGDGSVEGVSIVVPKFEFTETHFLPLATVNADYVRTLRDLTGTINLYEFREFAAGEVLFLGASGGIRTDKQDWSISFQFSVSPNRDISVGEILGDPSIEWATNYIPKRGHDYFWLTYDKTMSVSETTNAVTTRPTAAYVSLVYRSTDFALLGIGGGTGGSGSSNP